MMELGALVLQMSAFTLMLKCVCGETILFSKYLTRSRWGDLAEGWSSLASVEKADSAIAAQEGTVRI